MLDPRNTIHVVLTDGTVAMLDKMAEQDKREPSDKPDRSRTLRNIIREEMTRRHEKSAKRKGVRS